MSKSDGVALAGLSLDDILIERRSLRRQLAAQTGLQPIRIAVPGFVFIDDNPAERAIVLSRRATFETRFADYGEYLDTAHRGLGG